MGGDIVPFGNSPLHCVCFWLVLGTTSQLYGQVKVVGGGWLGKKEDQFSSLEGSAG